MAKLSIIFIVLTIVLLNVILNANSEKVRPRKTIVRRRKISTTEPSVEIIDSLSQTENFGEVYENNYNELIRSTSSVFLTTSQIANVTTTGKNSDIELNRGVQPIGGHGGTQRNSLSTQLLYVNETNGNSSSLVLTCPDYCNISSCIQPQDCQSETVLDHCSCCHICAAVEGDQCYNKSFNTPFVKGLGICGSNLDCLLRNDLSTNEKPEALCQCRDKRLVCGSDNTTYTSECKLREAAQLTPNLTVQSWYPCVTAPIISEMENVTIAVGEEVSLNCEVRAFPSATIYWQFLDESATIITTLPGDDSTVVVTIRGGPEKTMTSSWIQILSVSPRRQGIYFCIATNSEGVTRQQAYLSVYNYSSDVE